MARTREVASLFLQSAVVFDDEPFFTEPVDGEPASEEGVTEDSDGLDTGEQPHELVPPPPEPEPDHELGVYATALSDSFAREGLICGFLKPQPEEPETAGDLVAKAARRADIVVLDWSINRDQGTTTLGVIRQILAADEAEEEQRLRLIAIYTSRLETAQILERVGELVDEFLSDHTAQVESFRITKGPLRITLYAKETSHVVGTPAEERVRGEAELPRALIEEFAEISAGLVPLVALAGLAAVRGETHRILTVLSNALDPAYIGQRVLIPDQEEAAEQLVALLTSELRAVMEDRKVADTANGPAIQDWLRWKLESGSPLGIVTGNGTEEANLAALLAHGLSAPAAAESEEIRLLREEFKAADILSRSNQVNQVARLFAEDEATATRANNLFAMRVAVRTHYRNPPRVLQLGTILRDDAGRYLLCVQPVCDSVRMDENERSFPFLPALENSEEFDLVVRDPEDESWRTIQIVRRPYEIKLLPFRATPGFGCVQATEDEGLYRFTDTQNLSYLWIARLEEAYGQRFAQGLGAALSRVGLTEFEWLRKKAP